MPLAVCLLTALTLLDRSNVRFLHPEIPKSLESRIGQSIVFEGTVVSPPEAATTGFRTIIRGEGTRILLKTDGAPPLKRGDLIRFEAKLKRPSRYQNPGSFDYRRSLEREGIPLTAFVEDLSKIEVVSRAGGGFLGWMDRLRERGKDRFFQKLNPSEAGLLSALVVGDRSGVTPEIWDDFRKTGTVHLLSISGQHIAIVAGVAYALLLWLLKRSEALTLKTSVATWARGAALIPVLAYVLIAGSPASAVRALIVAVLAVIALCWKREIDAWSALAAAAIVIALLDPSAPFSASYQLSFLGVIGILCFRRSPQSGELATPVQRFVTDPLRMSLGATLMTAPVAAYHFHQISLSGIVTNVWAIPFVGVLMIFGFAILPLPFLIRPLGALTHIFLLALHRSADWTERSSAVLSAYPTELEVVVGLVSVFALAWLFRNWNWSWKRGVAVAFACGLVAFVSQRLDPAMPSRHALQVTFLDVGQGDSALMVTPEGKSLLIDGGGFLIPWGAQENRSDFDIGEREVVPYLKRLGLKRIDAILLSHPHPDHFGGLAAVVRAFTVGEWWSNGQEFPDESYQALLQTLQERGVSRRTLKAGDAFPWNGLALRVLYPATVSPARNINDNSLVVMLSYGDAKILFPGDIEGEGEREVSDKREDPIGAAILKIPHHGSKTSSSVPFVDSVHPLYAVASLGEDNMFGFPHEGILEKYERRGVKVFRTDRDGAVTFTIAPDFPKTPISIRTASSERSR